MRLLFIGIFSVILLSACNKGLSEEEVAQITSLQSQLEEAIENLNEVNPATIKEISEKYFADINYFQENFKDTVDIDFATFINKYYALNEMVSYLYEGYPVVLKELEINQKQLRDLKHDAKEGFVEAKYFDQYLDLEKENGEIIRETVSKMTRTYNKVMNAYDKMSPKIDSIIQEDKNNKSTS